MRVIILSCAALACCGAADWPKFGGPSSDFAAPMDAPLRWPATGPRVVWNRPLGEGYSSVVVAGSRLYTMFRRGEQEVVISLDAGTGKTIWEYAYDAPLPADFDVHNTTGPRATPLVAGDSLFTAGAAGKLHCLDRDTGKVRWRRDLITDFHGSIRVNGYAISPGAWNDTILVFPNAPGAAVAALRQSDGSVLWSRHSFTVSYASPILIKAAGREQWVAQFSEEVVGLDPASGDVLWSHPHTNAEKVNASTALWTDGLLFLSNAYDGGSRVLRLLAESKSIKVEEVWAHRQVRVHHSDAVHIGEVLYVASGDTGACPIAAADLKTGKMLWRDRTFPKASLIAAGKQLIILDEDGTLALGEPTATGLEVLGKAQLLSSNAWTAPVVIGKRIYLRDRKSLMAVELE